MKIEKISLLGYHEWGKPKYEFLGRGYPPDGSVSPSEDRLQALQDIMQSKGLQVTLAIRRPRLEEGIARSLALGPTTANSSSCPYSILTEG